MLKFRSATSKEPILWKNCVNWLINWPNWIVKKHNFSWTPCSFVSVGSEGELWLIILNAVPKGKKLPSFDKSNQNRHRWPGGLGFGLPPYLFPALSCLHFLDVMAVLLGSSLVLRLLQFHVVVEVALRRILHIFLLHFSFVVEALLASTLLSPSRRGGGM